MLRFHIIKKIAPTLFFLCGVLLLPVAYPVIKDSLPYIILGSGLIIWLGYLLRKAISREMFYGSFFLIFLLLLLLVAFDLAEKRLSAKGLEPGMFYEKFALKDTFRVEQYLAADETGLNYYERPMPWLGGRKLNDQGFISPFNFDLQTINGFRAKGKKIVFIIGDSFVEGVSQEGHFDSTFVERLNEQHPEWAICAFGIGSSATNNYALIAQRFVPLLKPDVVAIAFCWNDIKLYDIPQLAYLPLVYETSCGRLKSVVPPNLTGGNPQILRTPQEAYDYYLNNFTFWATDDLTNRYFRQTRVLTYLYRVLSEARMIVSAYPFRDSSAVYRNIQSVFSASQATGSRFAIAFIPDPRKINKITNISENHLWYGWVFKDLVEYVHFTAGDISQSDFLKENEHFNDSGNRKFSVFLDSIVCKELSKANSDCAQMPI